MNINNLCMGCMQEKSEQGGTCPYCGYDENRHGNKAHQLPIWTILKGAYAVGRALGDGGFGITYIGFDLNLQKKVAIKEFYPEGFCLRAADGKNVVALEGEKGAFFSQEKQRFVEEARILAQIDEQPGVVKVNQYFQENNTAYIVMEFLEGKTLMSILKENNYQLDTVYVLELIKPVVRALANIHDKGVVHKDISPDNVMILSDGRAKLIDFGAAKDKQTGADEVRVYKESYSPLEQRDINGEIGTYSDVYALCATIYRCITGRKVPSPIARMNGEVLYSPSQYGIQIEPLVEAAIMNGLEIDIDERIKNASDLYYFLYLYGKEHNASFDGMQRKIRESSTKTIMDKLAAEKRSDKRKKMIAFLAAVLLIMGMVVIGLRAIANRTISEPVNPAATATENLISKPEKKHISETDLAEYKAKIYDEIRVVRTGHGNAECVVSVELEDVANTFADYLINSSSATAQEWNQAYLDGFAYVSKEYGLSDTGWLVLPYKAMVEASVLTTDVYRYIEMNNQGIENPIDIDNCESIGIALKAHRDGTIFLVVLYK